MVTIITHKQAAEIDSLSRSQRERLVVDGVYPAPVQLSERRIGFVKSEIERWCSERIRARDRTKAAVRLLQKQAPMLEGER